MTERVRDFRAHLPRYFALPHPSWRTTAWERRNPWFGADVLPALRQAVADALRRLKHHCRRNAERCQQCQCCGGDADARP